jgi:hypothetical protein
MSSKTMHAPITKPIIIASRRLLVLIIDSKLLMPGIVSIEKGSCEVERYRIGCYHVRSTLVIRVLIPASEMLWRENSARVSYACLCVKVINQVHNPLYLEEHKRTRGYRQPCDESCLFFRAQQEENRPPMIYRRY